MVSLETRTSSGGDVTLVELLVTTDAPMAVRIENRLDGPVWPPRRQGVPAEGWDETGFEGVVEERLVLGYATPAAPTDTPAEIVSAHPVNDAAPDEDVTPEALVRSLGDARPPRDAIDRSTDAPAPGRDVPGDDTSGADPSDIPDTSDQPTPPAAPAEWLDAVDERLAAADRLSRASSVPEATEAVAAVGGAADVIALREQLAADREALARVQTRCVELAERAESVEIPAETLLRLA